MMNEKKFLKSQKECADILGMTLNQYNEYLKKTKVNTNIKNTELDKNFLEILNIKESQLKIRKD